MAPNASNDLRARHFIFINQVHSQIAPADILGEGVCDISLYGLPQACKRFDQRKKPPCP